MSTPQPLQRGALAPQKTMSSRLLTMKFMQRGAAASSPTIEVLPNRPNKRKRISNGKGNQDIRSTVHSQAVQAAVAVEEAKRQAALDRQTLEGGDTKWVLSVREDSREEVNGALRVIKMGEDGVSVGEGRAAAVGKAPWSEGVLGRRSFGMFNKAVERRQAGLGSSSEDSDSSQADASSDNDESSMDDEPSGIDALIREEEFEAARKDSSKMAQSQLTAGDVASSGGKRKREKNEHEKEEVNLGNLWKISGGGGGSGDMRLPTGKEKSERRKLDWGRQEKWQKRQLSRMKMKRKRNK